MAVRRLMLVMCFSAAIVFAWLVQVALEANAAPAPAPASNPPGWPTITLTTLTGGVDKPVYVTHAGDGSGRIFIVERPGRIRIYKNGALLPTPFLSITSRVESAYEERGLLSVAFPPNYTVKGHFYVYYTDHNGDLVIARYGLTGDPDVADSVNETIVLKISHPTNANHNGGQLQFGPDDGYLYLATGDGGGGGDTPNNAQTHNVLLGKMLRIDVETGNPVTYTIPPSNPYTTTHGYRPEIWALGLPIHGAFRSIG